MSAVEVVDATANVVGSDKCGNTVAHSLLWACRPLIDPLRWTAEEFRHIRAQGVGGFVGFDEADFAGFDKPVGYQ